MYAKCALTYGSDGFRSFCLIAEYNFCDGNCLWADLSIWARAAC